MNHQWIAINRDAADTRCLKCDSRWTPERDDEVCMSLKRVDMALFYADCRAVCEQDWNVRPWIQNGIELVERLIKEVNQPLTGESNGTSRSGKSIAQPTSTRNH